MRGYTIKQLALALTALTILPLATVLAWTVLTIGDLDRQRAGEQLQLAAHGAATDLHQRVDAARQLVAALAVNGALPFTGDACVQRFAELARLRPIYNNLFITDADGVVRCAAMPVKPANGTAASLAQRPYFEQALHSTEPVVAEAVSALSNGRTILPVVASVRDEAGRPVGIVGVALDLGIYLQGMGALLPQDTALSVWLPSGEILAHEGPETTMSQDVADIVRRAGRPRFHLASGDATVRGGDHPATIAQTSGLADDAPRVLTVEPVDLEPVRLVIGVSMPDARLFGPSQRLTLNNLIAAVVLAAGLGLLSVGLSHRLLIRPLQRLSGFARGMVDGRSDRRFPPVSGAREITHLSSSLNLLVSALDDRETQRKAAEAALQETLAGLEQTVETRTRELAEAHEAVRQRAQDLERARNRDRIAGRMTDLIQSCASVDEAVGVTERMMPALLPEDSGRLFLHKASRNLLEAAAAWGRPALPARSMVQDDCWSLRLGRPYVSDGDSPGDNRGPEYGGRGGEGRRGEVRRGEGQAPVCGHLAGVPGRHVCVPLIAHGEMLGMVTLERAPVAAGGIAAGGAAADMPAWSDDDFAALDRLALSIANVKLRETLRGMSIRDPLTGLFNRRFADEMLARELAVSRRETLPISVVMGDIDHFKRFNDTFGHEAGDRVIRLVARTMLEQFRESDVVCRYGGEEFLIVLPGCDAVGAFRRADAVRRVLAGLPHGEEVQPYGPVTISMGIACFPETVAEEGRLIAAADAALYRAKQTGRNRVMIDGGDVCPGADVMKNTA
ncbi:diguanylate cyclase [Tistrella bauzanensis]|uniref:sensor domain-containing diguanylate cyclase n=1 Tax=Tistrella TaxID=171436 RepID=UPI0031F607FC